MGKIIVLEDNILFAEVVCRWLQHEGWQTETITTISRAKKLMENADANDIYWQIFVCLTVRVPHCLNGCVRTGWNSRLLL